jgi:hypothetical protein
MNAIVMLLTVSATCPAIPQQKKDNFHSARCWMMNLLSLDRMRKIRGIGKV